MFLLTRMRNLLFSPEREWPRIRDEKLTNLQIFLKYVIWVAALPPLGYLLGFARYGNFLINLRAAILSYLIALISVDLSAYLVHLLAPSFEARKDPGRALKLVAFGATPVFVTGVLNFIPLAGSILWLIGAVYCAYLIYLGMPVLLEVPAARRVPYTVTAFAIFVAAYLLLLLAAGVIFEIKFLQMYFR